MGTTPKLKSVLPLLSLCSGIAVLSASGVTTPATATESPSASTQQYQCMVLPISRKNIPPGTASRTDFTLTLFNKERIVMSSPTTTVVESDGQLVSSQPRALSTAMQVESSNPQDLETLLSENTGKAAYNLRIPGSDYFLHVSGKSNVQESLQIQVLQHWGPNGVVAETTVSNPPARMISLTNHPANAILMCTLR